MVGQFCATLLPYAFISAVPWQKSFMLTYLLMMLGKRDGVSFFGAWHKCGVWKFCRRQLAGSVSGRVLVAKLSTCYSELVSRHEVSSSIVRYLLTVLNCIHCSGLSRR